MPPDGSVRRRPPRVDRRPHATCPPSDFRVGERLLLFPPMPWGGRGVLTSPLARGRRPPRLRVPQAAAEGGPACGACCSAWRHAWLWYAPMTLTAAPPSRHSRPRRRVPAPLRLPCATRLHAPAASRLPPPLLLLHTTGASLPASTTRPAPAADAPFIQHHQAYQRHHPADHRQVTCAAVAAMPCAALCRWPSVHARTQCEVRPHTAVCTPPPTPPPPAAAQSLCPPRRTPLVMVAPGSCSVPSCAIPVATYR